MSTITKQWLQKTISEMEEHRDLFPGDLDDNHENVLAALRIALASLEAEPVAYSLIFRNMDGVLNDYVNANTTFSTIEKAQAYGRGGNYVRQNDGSLKWVSDPSLDPVVVPLYTTPPAPVFVDEIAEQAGIDPDIADAYMQGVNDTNQRKLEDIIPNVIPEGLTGQIVYLCAFDNMPRYELASRIWNACRAAMLHGGKS